YKSGHDIQVPISAVSTSSHSEQSSQARQSRWYCRNRWESRSAPNFITSPCRYLQGLFLLVFIIEFDERSHIRVVPTFYDIIISVIWNVGMLQLERGALINLVKFYRDNRVRILFTKIPLLNYFFKRIQLYKFSRNCTVPHSKLATFSRVDFHLISSPKPNSNLSR